MKNITIAVDGPAGSGKSTVCKKAALECNLVYIDSGALYRAITWYFLEVHGEVPQSENLTKLISKVKIHQEFTDTGTCTTFVNNEDVSVKIRSERIAQAIHLVSDSKDIRNYVNELLRSWSQKESIIMDGRDIGSVVFPNADMKIFLDASVEIRAARRVHEYKTMGKNVDENEIKKQIIQRDKKDRERAFGALIQSEDMHYIDTSNMTLEEVIQSVVNLISHIQ